MKSAGAIGFVASALYILYNMPPRFKIWFMMVPNIIWFVLVCFQFFTMFNNSSYDWKNWVTMITEALVCLVIGYYAIKQSVIEKLKVENEYIEKQEEI